VPWGISECPNGPSTCTRLAEVTETITWQDSRRGELHSPFQRGERERPLRITLHTSSFAALPPSEHAAVSAIREMCNDPDIVALDTEPGPLPRLRIETFDPTAEYVPVTVTYPDGRITYTGVWFPSQWPELAANLAGQNDPSHPHAQAALADVLVSQAHRQAGQDVLITGSPWLLRPSAGGFVRETNPRKPSDTARLIGLFLRSRDTYLLQPPVRTNRWLWYWAASRGCLPSMWRYFSACVHAADMRGDDILDLGGSVLTRCARALEARDAVGIQFYRPQTTDTQEATMYHFDYLTLLLVGALDAPARVAHRAYGLPGNERSATFNWPEFRKRLQANGAEALAQYTASDDALDVMKLLFTLRHLVHGAALRSTGFDDGKRKVSSLVALPKGEAQSLWNAAQRHGSAEYWGMTQMPGGLMVAPYIYACALVAECHRLVDAIAAATDMARIFPLGHALPTLMDKPPDDRLWDEQTRQWLSLTV